MLRRLAVVLQKKQSAAGYMASAGKVGGEEKWAQAAMEYIYEKNHVNDGRKRQHDVDGERITSMVFDRYCAVNEAHYARRMERLIARMSEALEAIDRDDLREEALLLNSQQPPLNMHRPTLTPPIPGYEPAFGLDVPQLRTQQMEYPLVKRPTDTMEFGAESPVADTFPYAEVHDVVDLTASLVEAIENQHSDIREAAPLTGVEGEAWEAYIALNKKALARQQLILDLSSDSMLQEKYNTDDTFRQSELERRGIIPLLIEDDEILGEAPSSKPQAPPAPVASPLNDQWHFAQEPTYEPFRRL